MSASASDSDRHGRRFHLSFEFFPPKSEVHDPAFGTVVKRLARFAPDFVSVTYGAAGSSQARSISVVRQVAGEGLPTAAHLTCVGASRASLEQTIDSFRAIGIERFAGIGENLEAHRSAAAEIAAEQILELGKRGVDAFHIYTINGSALTEAVLGLCGIEAGRARRAA